MCVLRVSSARSSFSVFLSDTIFPCYQSHEKGDRHHIRKPTFRADFGFSCNVSRRKWTDFEGQVTDAIRFLVTNSVELDRLLANCDVDDIRLDFPVESQLSDHVLGQYDYLPPELVRLCAQHGIGIELSQYARDWGDRCEQADSPNPASEPQFQIQSHERGTGDP